jgi:hypothetical protein
LTAVSTSAPSSPSTGDLWIDTSVGQVLKAWNGSVWITISAGSGANQLNELSDVGVSTPTDGNVLSADGTDFDSKTPDSAGLVAKTGAQTINGIKTFGSFPVTPSSAPTTDYQTANKKYVDDNAGGGGGADELSDLSDVGVSTPTSGNVLSADGTDFDSKTPDSAGLVAKTGAQTIDGIKTFGSFPVTPSSAPTADYQTANKKYVDDNEYTGSKNNMEEDDKITITHPSETAYDPRIVNFAREVLGADTNWSSLDFDTGDESSFEQGDVKGTIAQLECDTANVSGHFETSGNAAVSIGSGNTEDRVQAGCRFKIGSTWYEITEVTGDGSGANGVDFTFQDGTVATLATGVHAVTEIVGTEFIDGKVQLNIMEGEYSSDVCTH